MNLKLLLKGAAMGVAEAIPGVSGGTIAFITGIYEELIETIKSFTPSGLLELLKSPKTGWQTLNGTFLLWLLLGMGLGICLLYTSPSPRDLSTSRMPSSA